jgi:ATP-dependent Clp protease adapter protein ClpS
MAGYFGNHRRAHRFAPFVLKSLSLRPTMSIFSRLKASLEQATAAPVKIAGLSFPVALLKNPGSFAHGLELQNDAKTPIEFVVKELQACVGLSAGDASVAAALCHSLGGVIVPLHSAEAAASAVQRLAASAAASGYRLGCRAVAAPMSDLTAQC